MINFRVERILYTYPFSNILPNSPVSCLEVLLEFGFESSKCTIKVYGQIYLNNSKLNYICLVGV